MVQRVVNERDAYSTQIVDVVRTAGLLVPVIIIVYGILAYYGVVSHSPIFSITSLLTIAVLFIAAALFEITISRSLYAKFLPYLLVIYTLLASAYSIWIGGFESPAVFSWIVLLIACDLYYGKTWFWINAFSFLVTSVLAYLLLPGDEPVSTLIRYVSVAVFVSLVGAVISALRSVQVAEHSDLQRTRAEEQSQREALLNIINGVPQAIFTVGATGTVRIYNAALLNLLDTNQSMSGKKVDDILPLYNAAGEPVSLLSLMDKTPRLERDDIILRFEDGDAINLHITGSKIQKAYSAEHQQVSGGYTFILRDITKQKSLDEERDEFISVVSHELRTPVTIVEGSISNIQYFMKNGAEASKLVPTLENAHDQIVLLANMINDLGTLSRAERGVGDQLEDIDIRELVDQLYGNYAASARKKGLSLNLDAGAKLGVAKTSRLYLEELLQNLITNAIKYTQEGSVTLSVHRKADGIEFAVKDTGIGIGKADLKHIFEKFYRSEDYRTRETSGTGLGLYVVNKLMHKLGTRVDVKSRLNHGSTFSFVLPEAAPNRKA
jgi:two-component system, OmpR family, phosphate regulon sensor histidine kinase PhoR